MRNGVRRAASVLAAIALLALPVLISVSEAGAAETRSRYIVLFNDSVERPGEIARAQVEKRNGRLGFVYRHGLEGYSAALSDGAVDALRNDPRVRAVRPDRLVVPAVQTIPTGIDRIFATANKAFAINGFEGLGVDADVAVLDTGIDLGHPDLEVVARTYCNGFESASCTDGIGTDEVGHGTHVAGTIAAQDNGEGVVGVAPGARLWSVKVLDPGAWESELVAGVEWVTENASEIEVANMSIGCEFMPCYLPTMGEAIDISVEAGVVYVVAAGNNGEDANESTFGTNPSVITVSALADFDGEPEGEAGFTECRSAYESEWGAHNDDSLAIFSNWGSAVEVAAPGVCILSTVPGNKYAEVGWWGTSMASPHVAGTAAFLAALEQPETKEDVEAIREMIIEEGNFAWEDTSGDEIQEPLLDVSNEGVFGFTELPTIETKAASGVTPTKATLKGNVTPNGLSTTYQFEYGTTTGYGSKIPASPESIGSGKSPVEVSDGLEGLTPDTTYHFRLVATNAKGTAKGPGQTFATPSWVIQSTLNPEGANDTNLHDVSCESSTSLCTAVGKSTSSGVDSPLTHRWNGSSWSEQTPAKKAGAVETRLFGVDCPSTTRCMAVGSYETEGGQPTIMAELWNENKWSNQTTPTPSESTSSEFTAVGCNNTAECTAVGSAVIGGVKKAIAEEWNSPTWTLATIPIPEGATSSQLDGVDCLWSNFCVAVGRYTTSGGAIKSLVMFWNGTEWKLQTVTDPEGATQSTLLDVSCTPSPNRCTAVGGWKNSATEQFTLAYRFNGVSTWTLQSTPNPAGSIASVFQEVSCATETSCTAAGSWVSEGGGSNQTLAEKWNGTSWSIQGTQNPAGATFTAFFGVSCRETSCLGVGWSTDGSGVDTTLAEFRE